MGFGRALSNVAGIFASLFYLTKASGIQEMYSLLRRNLLIGGDDILQYICADGGGGLALNEYYGPTEEDCIYAELIDNWYTGSVLLRSADRRYSESMNYLSGLMSNIGGSGLGLTKSV